VGDDAIWESLRSVGPIGALLATLATLLASVVRAILSGALIPRKSHEEIVNTYRERATEAITREQWWRDQAYSENHVASRTIDIAADLATRHTLTTSARKPDRGDGDE